MTRPLSFRILQSYARLAWDERGGFRLSRLARRTLPRARWNDTFDVGNGLRLRLDLATYPDVAMAGGVYELDTLRLLQSLVRPGMTVVDGGANLGYFTCHLARLVGPDGRAHAVEPDPVNRARLEENLYVNDLSQRVMVHAFALAEAAGEMSFHRPAAGSHRNHGESGRNPPPSGPSETFPVQLRRLDALVPDPPDLVKLDLEGSEMLAVEGAAGWAGSAKTPTWIIEHNADACRRAGRKPGDVWRVLRDLHPDYRCAFLHRQPTPIASPESLDTFAGAGNVLFDVA